MNGLKYNDCNATYAKIREVSDRLCREYGLSVVEHPQGKGMSYGEWKSEQEGVPTLRSSIQRVVIYYRFVGYLEIPDEETRFLEDTWQGVSVEYISCAPIKVHYGDDGEETEEGG